jgi:hypothetical protein
MHRIRATPRGMPSEQALNLQLPDGFAQVNRNTDSGGRIQPRNDIAPDAPTGIGGVERSIRHDQDSSVEAPRRQSRAPRRATHFVPVTYTHVTARDRQQQRV